MYVKKLPFSARLYSVDMCCKLAGLNAQRLLFIQNTYGMCLSWNGG